MTTFAEFMEKALYGTDGYYSSGRAQTGTRGDYFTAPETGETFGRLLKNIFAEWRTRLPMDPFWIIEAGAGEGLLMRAMMDGRRPGEAYVVVERSAARREKIRQLNLPIQIHGDFSEINHAPVAGIIFANELIDAFPVHRVRMNKGRLEEAYIGQEVGIRRQALGYYGPLPNSYSLTPRAWSSPSTPRLAAYFDRLKISLPEGYETEVNLVMADWIRQAAAALSQGIIVLIDYGRPAWDYYAQERTGGTLRGFKDHRVLGLPELLAEGSQADWTSDVDFTSLVLDAKEAGLEPLAFMEMGTFLRLGVKSEGLSVKGNDPLLFTLHPLRYLLHPDGLGAQFHVLILGKNMNPSEWKFEHNRIARLGLPA